MNAILAIVALLEPDRERIEFWTEDRGQKLYACIIREVGDRRVSVEYVWNMQMLQSANCDISTGQLLDMIARVRAESKL